MKPDLNDIDGLLEQHLPSASAQQVENAGMRVLHRLRTGDAATARELDPHLDAVKVPVGTWRRTSMAWAAAAAVVAIAVGTAVVWKPASRLAVVETVDTSLSREVGGMTESLSAGSRLETGEPVRTAGDAGAVIKLADGSSVEMRSKSELSLERELDGLSIRLHTGSIIVNAAKQRNGHLYVKTKDVTVSVVGTVFLVNAEDAGSRVGVIEGEVRVREGQRETSLRPGQQVTTGATLVARPLKEEIAWSRNVDALHKILDTFMQGMAATAGPLQPLRETSASAGLGAGQNRGSAGQEFDEASIRPCDPDNVPEAPAGARGGGANSLQMTPGRLHALCLTLATIVRHAYGYGPADLDFLNPGGRGRGLQLTNVYGLGVEDGKRVRGGPDWVRSEHYTIDAVAADGADAASMMGPMIRALLERRFNLKVHVESEQIPAWAITVAPGGLKIKEGTCTPADPSEPPIRSIADVVRRNLEAARRGETTGGRCGFVGVVNGPNRLFVGAGAGIPAVGFFLGAPVIDRTGIPATARFNYVLEFAPDERTRGPGVAQGLANEPSDIPRAPDLFTALEQLGLKLEPASAPREFIVIDRVERPSAN